MPISNEPMTLNCKINDVEVKFEIDSGSGLSTLRYADAKRVGATVTPTQHRIVGYSGGEIHLCGEATTNFEVEDRTFHHKFLVVNSNKINLLGRDLCRKLNIQFTIPSKTQTNAIHSVQHKSLIQFKDYLSSNYKSNVKETVALKLTDEATPIFCKARTVPIRMRELVKKELNKLVDNGTITKIYSSKWASPTVNVMKSNNSVRICGDFSATVNKYLDPVNTTLPLIEDVISQVGNCTVFSKIDMANAFLQLPLEEASKDVTVINTTEGLFRFNYLPFGLTASSGIFQSFMCKLLNGIDNVIVYQDDILVMSPTINDHDKTLCKVLSTLQEAGIKLNDTKCAFFIDRVQYLGHIFDREGVHPNPDKIKAILQAPAPKDLKQLQSFLGLCNFYSRFINNFSHVLSPLYHLLKKETKFHWGSEQSKSFHHVKDLFKTNKVLKMFNPNHDTLLETDSSGYGIGAVLMQRENSSAQWLPVQFCSRTLNDGERNYSNLEREALSVIFGLNKYRKFLLGKQFTIRNDQQPLRTLFAKFKKSPENCSARITNWALTLSQYNYVFEYSPGKNNVNSDCLSRLPLPETTHETTPYEMVFALNALEDFPITATDIKNHTDSDKDMTELKHYIKFGSPNKISNPILSPLTNKIGDMTIFQGCILYNNKVFVPSSLRNSVLNIIHDNHPGIVAMKAIARSLVWFPGIDAEIENLVKSCPECNSVRSKPAKVNLEFPVPNRKWSRIHVDHFFMKTRFFFLLLILSLNTLSAKLFPPPV